jgi:hypothetical protein
MHRNALLLLSSAAFVSMAHASLVATYDFNNTLAAIQPGVAALTAVDPLGLNGFQSNVNVFGTPHTVYHFDGANTPVTDQGGLQLDTTGLIGSNDYSVEMVFELDDRNNAWRRVLDTLDRQSDAGLYIDPGNVLDVFPVAGAGGTFTPATFFDVFVTVDASDNIAGYFSGVPELNVNSNVMDISAANHLNFFLDNVVGGGQGEWSKGNIALIKIYNTALTAAQVQQETADPFSGTTPEPDSWLLMLLGTFAIWGVSRLRRRAGQPVR